MELHPVTRARSLKIELFQQLRINDAELTENEGGIGMAGSLIEHFSQLDDPRIDRHKQHELVDIIVLCVCAVVGGAEGWEAIEEFGKAKLSWLRKHIPLANGIPAHDTIARVISRLSSKGLQECFLNWIQSVTEMTDGEIVAIDGKTLRRSYDRSSRKQAIHMVSAWANANGVVLGQVKTSEKSNEITAIPKLLEVLELKGCIVTLDAMGCQRKIAEQIIEKGADYVLAVKGNQDSLYDDVFQFMEEALEDDFEGINHDYFEASNEGHGRYETRRYWVTDNLTGIRQPERWKGLKALGMVESERRVNGETSFERRYYILSFYRGAQAFGHAIRSHWGIENSLHWVLDVTFREDESRIRRGAAPENLATLRHIAINLLKQETTRQKSLKQKRLRAGWDNDYLGKVLFG